MKKPPLSILSIITEFREELKNLYSDRLRGVILFGSYARGDYTEESDIDLALLIDGMGDITAERDRYIHILSRLSLKHDILISAVPFDYVQFYHENTPLSLNVKKEGFLYE